MKNCSIAVLATSGQVAGPGVGVFLYVFFNVLPGVCCQVVQIAVFVLSFLLNTILHKMLLFPLLACCWNQSVDIYVQMQMPKFVMQGGRMPWREEILSEPCRGCVGSHLYRQDKEIASADCKVT